MRVSFSPNSAVAALACWLGCCFPAAGSDLKPLMPQPEDQTSMWWKEGFPGVVEGAPWHRCIRTGLYAFVLDTETLDIPHLGPVDSETELDELPSADLDLEITVDGKTYRATTGGSWSRYGGPRLVESGRFFQRADVTDLDFAAEDGTRLNVEARFETAAWPDQLALILAARPGAKPIPAGEESFGRVRGGFGLNGTNHFKIPADPKWETESFTLEFWTFVPLDYQATKVSPWLVCKSHHEQADGNVGITIRSGAVPQARINLGGGKENAHTLEPDNRRPLNLNAWNHLALSYDGETFRLFANGQLAGEKRIGKPRPSLPSPLTFGRRGDNFGDGYYFRGVVDEVRLYDRSLSLEELRLRFSKPEADRPTLKPIGEWTFQGTGNASMIQPKELWEDASLEIRLADETDAMASRWELPIDQDWSDADWREVALRFDPVTRQPSTTQDPISVTALEVATGNPRPVEFEPSLGWHRINLDGIDPILPPDVEGPSNDAIERVTLNLSNPTDGEQVARLLFEKTARGFRQRIGTPITGLSAILRDASGNPTGIPIQLSKNWHNDPEGGVYAGQWFHGITQVRLPPASETKLEITLAYGHWGGVPAASHAQLSLIGWGSNQLWDQSAIGSWGESICYEPDQVQRGSTIMDVRPVMVRSMGNKEQWGWTNNVGGGDWFRLFQPGGDRLPHSAMQTTYHRQGPGLTEVTYAGNLGEGIEHSATVSLARTDDLVRGVYRVRMRVEKATDVSRFVIFQIGADNYSSTPERKMAIGNETGLLKEWDTQWGGDTYRTPPIAATGQIPWISLHEVDPQSEEIVGALANRGIVVREWNAQLGGKEAAPWFAERGLNQGRKATSTIDLVPPPGVTRLEPGDFVEATLEHLVIPQFAADYYGPNEALQAALEANENTWRMVHREAVGNDRKVVMEVGTLDRVFPDIRVQTKEDEARFQVTGGLGYVPLTFTGLRSPKGYELRIDDVPLDQAVHGSDFWQTDYDPKTQTWSRTYNVPIGMNATRTLHFRPKP